MPVLPPTELSTWASRVVGIWTKSMPRSRTAAAKPVRSPTTPPPSATSVGLAVEPLVEQVVHQSAEDAPNSLLLLARRHARSHVPRCRPSRRGAGASAGRARATVSSVTMTTRGRAPAAGAQLAGAIEQAGADQDVVAAVGERRRARCCDVVMTPLRSRVARRCCAAPRSTCSVVVGRTAPSIDDDVGLGIDRVALRPSGAPSTSLRVALRCSSGRWPRARTPGRPARRGRRAARPRRPARASAPAVSGSMKAPPPVASTCGGPSSRRAMTRRSPSRNAASP